MTNHIDSNDCNILREFLGIIVDLKTNDLFTYRNKNIDFNWNYSTHKYELVYRVYSQYNNIKNKIDLCNNIYFNLIKKNNKWRYLPIYRNLWNFNIYNYRFKKKIDSQIYLNESNNDIKYTNQINTVDIFEKIISFQNILTSSQKINKRYYLKILYTQNCINWNKIITNNQKICPSCKCTLHFKDKTCIINNIKIYKYLDQYRMTGTLHCKNCKIFDCPENKKIIKYIDKTLSSLSNDLLSKYYQKNILIPKYYWYIINTFSIHKNKISDMLIVFLQLKKFINYKLNILFKLVISYLI